MLSHAEAARGRNEEQVQLSIDIEDLRYLGAGLGLRTVTML